MLLIDAASADDVPNETTIMAVRNVAAALSIGIRRDSDESCHYLDNIKSCGEKVEDLIRQSFFKIIQGVSRYLAYTNESSIIELLSCFDWGFKARDFE